MQLQVISPESNKKMKDLKVGDMLLCDDGLYHPIKSIFMSSGQGSFHRLSNSINFHLSARAKVKTINGFKPLELNDTLELFGKSITPTVIDVVISTKMLFFHDIMIDGNIVSPEGIVFKYGD